MRPKPSSAQCLKSVSQVLTGHIGGRFNGLMREVSVWNVRIRAKHSQCAIISAATRQR